MDANEFRKRGREMVDFIADYMTNIDTLRVVPEVEPGYLKTLLPSHPPKKSDDWQDIMDDVKKAIMPGITHWQHPNFHAYFPSGNSYPSILGDMLSDAFGCIGFSWAASPACTELETLMLDWVGKMINIPHHFLHESGVGGGVIQGSASECVLVALLSARHKVIKSMKEKQPYVEEGHLLSKLVGYCSKLAHSCVEKAGMIGYVKIRQLDVDDHYALRGRVLEDAIEEDRKLGLIPFFVCATLGTTACCSFDNISEIGQVTTSQGLYLHVDGAYAGNALICPEFQYLASGLEYVDSFGFNTNKWLQVNFDCSLMWVRKVEDLTTALTVDPLYLQHKHGHAAIDLRHWSIPLSRRFRALKLWFVIRSYGVDGLQDVIRRHVRLAKFFHSQVLADDRFEILGEVKMGLVCFRLKGSNALTQKLLRQINDSGNLHMVPSMINECYVIRFALCTEHACLDDVLYAWDVISSTATQLQERRQSRASIKAEELSEEIESGLCPSPRRSWTKKWRLRLDTPFLYRDQDGEETLCVFEEQIIYDNQREHVQRAQATRNFFFKMISDPKHYSARVMKSQGRQTKSAGRDGTVNGSKQYENGFEEMKTVVVGVRGGYDRRFGLITANRDGSGDENGRGKENWILNENEKEAEKMNNEKDGDENVEKRIEVKSVGW